MKVKLSAIGNPDFNQPENIGIPTTWVEVADYQEASKVCREFISRNALGGGNWNGGEVRQGDQVIAKVSYNGRVWPPGTWTPRMKALYP